MSCEKSVPARRLVHEPAGAERGSIMTQDDAFELDLPKLLKALWKKAWAIVLVAVIFGGIMFAYGKYTYVPVYTAKATLYTSYISHQDLAFGDSAGNISQSSLSEARSLVNTCVAVLNTRATLEGIIEAADLDMAYTKLSGMIHAAAVSGTELFTIEVTGTDAAETALIANTAAQILPEKVSTVNSNSFVGVIDSALVPQSPNPNRIVKDAAIAAVLGAMLVFGIVVVQEVVAVRKANPAVQEKKNEEES